MQTTDQQDQRVGFVWPLSKRIFSLILLNASLFNITAHAEISADALPTGGHVAAGSAQISQQGTTMNVNQSSDRAVINWNSFDVGSNATVNFNQPNANSATLNRVTGATPSMINGAINANGHVVFVNPNGVVFGTGAQVNAGAITATTMNIADADFMAGGHQTYAGGASGKVINHGRLTVNSLNGYIALMAPEVRNEGVLIANISGANAIALVAGQKVTLSFSNNQLINVSVDAAVINALIENKRLIKTNGGQIIVAANSASDLKMSVINNTGVINASGVDTSGGKIVLTAATIHQRGDIEANANQSSSASSASNLKGGQITLVGEQINLVAHSKTTATGVHGGGQILIGTQVAKPNINTNPNNKLAINVNVESSAVIDASATQNGRGGNIDIWSTSKTTVAGILKATGGLVSGHGGLIETNSHGQVKLEAGLLVDTSASQGEAGHWVVNAPSMMVDASSAALISQALETTNVTLNAASSVCSNCTTTQRAVIDLLAGADIHAFNVNTAFNLIAQSGDIYIRNVIHAANVYVMADVINVDGNINSNAGNNGNVLLAGATINLLGSISANGNTGSNSTGSAGSSSNTGSTSTRRRDGTSTALEADTNTYITNGGNVQLIATGDLSIGNLAYVSANGFNGGNITIASTTGQVNIEGIVDAVGKQGSGGHINIAGKTAIETINALISVDGLVQGGMLNLGVMNNLSNGSILAPPATAPPANLPILITSYLNAALSSDIISSHINIGAQSNFSAANGNIIVFGDQIEVNHSTIIAHHGVIIIGREGYSSGGLSKLTAVSNSTLIAHKVETSAELLGTEAVTVLASEWLLDPTNITISSGAANASTGGSLAAALANAGAVTITTTDIQNAINLGTSVNIVGSGWIQVNSALTFTNNSGTEATLTLSNTIAARQYIHVKANITATAGNTPVNVVIRSAGGQILVGFEPYAVSTAGLINVSGDVTLDNTFAVNGSVSGFISDDNNNTNTLAQFRSNAPLGTQAGVKNTATIRARSINMRGVINDNGAGSSSGVWIDASITATNNINVRGDVSMVSTTAVGAYVNRPINIISNAGTVNITGRNRSFTKDLSSWGVYFRNVNPAAVIQITANQVNVTGYSDNAISNTANTAPGTALLFVGVNVSTHSTANYSAGGTAISLSGYTQATNGMGIALVTTTNSFSNTSGNGSINMNSNGGDILFISNSQIYNSLNTINVAKNTTGIQSKILYDTTSGPNMAVIVNYAKVAVGTGGDTAVNLIQKTNGGLIYQGGTTTMSGYIDIDNTNGSLLTPTISGRYGVSIGASLSAGSLAGSNGLRVNAISSGAGQGIIATAPLNALAGPVKLTATSQTAQAINLSAAATVNSNVGIDILGASSLASQLVSTYGTVSALGTITNTGNGGVNVQSTGDTSTGSISDSGSGGINITGGHNIAAGTLTGGTITAVGTLTNTGGGVISLSMAQPSSGTGGVIEDAAGVTNAVASINSNVTYSLRGGVMNSLFSGVNNVNYRSPLTPATISVQLLNSYVTTYGVAFTDAAPQAWIKDAVNSAVTVSGSGAFGAAPSTSSVLSSLSLASVGGVNGLLANRVGGPTTLVTGDIVSPFGTITITPALSGAGTYTVNRATLTITSKSSSSVYNGVTTFNTLTQAGYSVTGLISTIGGTPTGDAVTSTTSAINVGNDQGASVSGSGVATAGTYSVIESLAQGSNLSNYSINYVRSTFNVTPATLTITAANDSKTYGSTTTNAGIAYNVSGVKTLSTDGFTVAGLLGSDTVTSATLTSSLGAIAAANASTTPYAITPSAAAGAGLGNYTITYINGGLTVNKAVLTITNPTMVYNGTTTFTAGTSGANATVTGAVVNGVPQTFTLGGSATMTNGNVIGGSNITSTTGLTFTGSGSSNYELPASIANVVITPAPLTVTLAPQTKVYDSTTGAVLTAGTASSNGSYTITGFVSGQGAYITKTQGAYNFANASTSGLVSVASTVSTTLGANDWTANSGTSLSNYSLPTNLSAAGTITKAPLAILANDVSTFVNTPPASGSLTYVVSGLVGTDTPGSAFTVAPAVALASDASLASPGVFAGKVVPSVTAPNYTLTATPGTLTVLGNNAILVAVGTTSKVYGTYNASQTTNIQADIAALGSPIVTVQYKPAVSGVVNFTVARDSSTGVWTAVDGVSGNSATYTFTVTPTIPTGSYSTTNHLRVGSYALVPANLTLTSATANCPSCTVSYTSGTLTITPAQLLATVTPGAMTYNASNAITSTTVLSGTGVFSGVPSGVSGVTTLTAASPNAGITAINNGGTLLSGPDAANFTVATTVLVPQASGGPTNGVAAPGTATTDGSGYTINIAKAPLVYSGVVRSSVYTGNAQTNTGATLTSGTLYSTDNFTIAGYASATNVSQGTVADVLVATAAGSTLANNYAITYNHGSLTITGAPLIITATSDSKTYGSTTTNSGIAYNASGVKTLTTDGYTVGGLIGSDAVNTVTLTSSSGAIAAANVVGSPYAITPSAAAGTGLSNYTISYVNGALTVNPAVLTLANATMVYNGTTTFAPGVSGASNTFTGVNGQTVTIGGSATMTNGNVLGTSAINNTSGLTIASVSGGVDASNYALPSSIANVDITPAPLTYTGANNTTVFNNTQQTNSGATVTAGTLFGSDNFVISGYAKKTDVSGAVGSYTATPDALVATASGTTNPNNYTITYVQGGLTITPAPLTATVTPAALIYDGSNTITSSTVLSGFVGGATDVSGTTALTAGSSNAGTQTIINGGTSITGTDSLNYAVTNTVIATTSGAGANGVVAVNPAPNGSGYSIDIVRRVLIYTGVNTVLPYTGSEQTNVAASLTTGTVVSGQSFTLAGYAKATNVVQGKVMDQLAATAGANTLAANYDIRYVNGSITLTPLTLSVAMTPPSSSKVYDSTTAATLTAGTAQAPGSYAITGFVAGQGAYITQTAGTYNSANVAGANTITAALTPSVWTATGSTDLSNYVLPTSTSASATITRAPLSITANNAATFVGVTPTNLTYVISGLVGTDTPDSAFTGTPTVSLNSAGTTGLGGAGTYVGSLIPAVTAANYTVTPTAGTLTVVGNSILVVSVGTTSQVFGTYNQTQVENGTISKAAPTVTVGYCSNCSDQAVIANTSLRNIVNLTVTAPSSGTTNANSLWTAYDSMSGTTTVNSVTTNLQGRYNFTITPTVAGGSYSTGNYLKVGNYALVPNNVTTVAGYSTNYQGTPIYTSGNLEVTPLTLTFAAATPTQTYNGLTAINSVALTPTNLPAGMTTGITSVIGSGNYVSPNASNAAAYTINNAVISGPDAANFVFAGASGSTGVINKAALTYTGAVRESVFNGATQTNSGATLTAGMIATGESFTIGGYAQQRNVLATATPDTLIATAGANTLASNYQITYNHGSLRITPAPLTATVTAVAKTYNGSNAITSSTVLTGFVGGATSVTGATNLTAATADAGSQVINNGGTTLSGDEAANYSVTTTVLASTNGVAPTSSGSAQANGSGYSIAIAKAPLTFTAPNTTKVFNGSLQTSDPAILTSGSIVAGQGFTISGYATATYVNESGFTNLVANPNSNTNINNYEITIFNGELSMTPAPLTISGLSVSDKTYDGNTNAVISGTPTLAGQIFAGNQVAIESGSVTAGLFANPAVSSATAVSVDLSSFVISNPNYYIQGLTQPLAARINAIVVPSAPSQPGSSGLPQAVAVPEQLLMNRVANNQGLVATPVSQVNASNVALNQVHIKTEGAGLTILISHQTSTGSSYELLKVVNSNSLVYEVPNALLNNVNAQTEKVLSYEAKLEDGNALPAWLKFDTRIKTFSASSVPANALPLKVRVLALNKDKMLAEKVITINKVE